MRRAVLAFVLALGALSTADARPLGPGVDEATMSPSERGYIYRPDARRTLQVGTLIAVGIGIGIGVLVIALLTRTSERYTSEPSPPPS